MKIKFDEGSLRKFKSGAELALAIVAVAGVTGVALTMPGLASVIAKGMFRYNRHRNKQIYLREIFDSKKNTDKVLLQRARQSLIYLRKQGYVKVAENSSAERISITRKGLEYISWLDVTSVKPKVEEKWDGSWWVILSDIPTKTHRRQAELLRLRLRSIGFFNMQKSVWIYPFDPAIALNKITSYYGLGRYVALMKVLAIDEEDGKRLKKHFNL